MTSKSIFYRHPLFYLLGLKLLHKCNISKRNQYIASFIKEKETVLEPGCGPGILAFSLSKKVKYRGFDINESFIAYGKKRGLNIYHGNIMDKSNYQKSDVIIVSDVLHHLRPEDRKKFLLYCYSFTKRLFIICDCTRKKENLWRKIMRPVLTKAYEILDKDGTNQPRYNEACTEKGLRKEIKNGFGLIPKDVKREVKKFGIDLVAVFFKNDSSTSTS